MMGGIIGMVLIERAGKVVDAVKKERGCGV